MLSSHPNQHVADTVRHRPGPQERGGGWRNRYRVPGVPTNEAPLGRTKGGKGSRSGKAILRRQERGASQGDKDVMVKAWGVKQNKVIYESQRECDLEKVVYVKRCLSMPKDYLRNFCTVTTF